MRGTIYYWAINTGRVMRIKPGATAPDKFLAPMIKCPSCHTVSANGSNLVTSEGDWPNTTSIGYNLGADANTFSGYPVSTGASRWSLAGVSASDKVIVESFAPLRGQIGVMTGALDALTGAAFVQEGVGTEQLWVAAIDQNPARRASTTSAPRRLRPSESLTHEHRR